jgi:hypothetical protein
LKPEKLQCFLKYQRKNRTVRLVSKTHAELAKERPLSLCSCKYHVPAELLKQDELMEFAEAPSVALTEESSENKEEAELEEGWDLHTAEDTPTECLADHEEEIMVLSRQNLIDRTLQ